MRKRFVNRAISLLLTLVLLVGMVPAALAITVSDKPADGTVSSTSTSATVPFPKGTGGSNSFRIPAMVTLSDGIIVAAADARWNTTYDGGGLDTIVARSGDNGVNWNYTFANYLGDNGNKNNASSTAFIDPALAVKTINSKETIFMLVDLYPHGVALNGGPDDYPCYDTGFNSNGNLLLSGDNHSNYDYYLDGTTIRNSGGSAVSGLTVDAYFNITGTYNETTYNTNLFFSDSPFQVARTGFLYLTTSTDKGASWSAPTLIPNLKTADERVCLVGPGRGLVTTKTNGSLPAGTIIFPVYSFDADSSLSEASKEQYTGFIYSSDNGASWARSANFKGASWSSESAVVELSDGTLRFFYRNGTTNLCYVDYTNNAWGSPVVETSLDTNSNCQISAITYSKTVNGQQVILVSCPAGPDNAGSDQSGASYRKNGKIFVGLVNTDTNKTISWQTKNTISVPSVNSDDSFMYSCLTELKDENGTIAILYEDNEAGWGTGDDKYYQMSYATFELGLTFDEAEQEEEPVNAYFTQDGTNPITTLTINMADSNATVTLANVDTASQTVTATSSNTGVATVRASDNVLTITPVAAGETTITATVSNALTRAAVAQEYTLTVTVTAAEKEEPTGEYTLTDSDSGVVITVGNPVLTSISVAKKATANTPHTGYTACATYNVVINDGAYTDAAEIKIPYDSSIFDDCDKFIGDVGGDTFAVELVDGYFVGTAPHFSDVDVNGLAEVSGEYSEIKTVTLGVGDSAAQDPLDGHQGTETDSAVATANGVAEYTITHNTTTVPGSTTATKQETLTTGTYKIGDGTNFLTFDGSNFGITTDAAAATDFTITTSGDTYTIEYGSVSLGWNRTDNDFVLGTSYSYEFKVNGTYGDWSYDSTNGFYSSLSSGTGLASFGGYSNYYLKYDGGMVFETGNNGLFAYTVSTTSGTTTNTTTVSITGLQVGTTSIVVGDTLYNVTVNGPVEINIYYQLDGVTVYNEIKTVNSSDTSITLSDTVTVDGFAFDVDDTTLELTSGVNTYLVPLSGGKFITINYTHESTVIKTETQLVADDTNEITLADTVIVDGESFSLTDTTLTLNDKTIYEVPVFLTIGITIQYQTENGYVVRTVLKSVAEDETGLTLAHTIEGTDGNTYTVTGETGDFALDLSLPGQTVYTVPVDYIEVPVTLTVGSNYQIAHAEGYDGSGLTEAANSSYNFTDGTLTVTGITAGDGGYVIVNSTKYVFTVMSELHVTVKTGETLEIDLSNPDGFNLTLLDGQYVAWETSDSTYAGVAGVYDNTNKKYTDAAVIAGQTVTPDATPVTVTATVYNADGTISGTYNWIVTVIAGTADTNTTQKWVYLAVDKLIGCDLYYSINGGPLKQIVKTSDDLHVEINEPVTGKYFLAIFAAPDHKGALTSMKATYSNGDFSILVNGDPDGVGSDAWPFADNYDWTQYDEYYSTQIAAGSSISGNDTAFFDTTCGFRWALAEGNLTAQQYKLMLSNAIDLGCEGAICFTKNAATTDLDEEGKPYDDAEQDNDIHTVLTVVGQDLPHVTKQISRVEYEIDNGDGTTTTAYRKAVNEEWGIKLFDTIIYDIVVTIPAQIESGDSNLDYGHFTFTNMTLSDTIMGSIFTDLGGTITYMSGSGSSLPTSGTTYKSGAVLYTNLEQPAEGSDISLNFEASIQLTPANFNALFGGASANEASLLSNTVSLNYSYKSDYASAAASKTDTEEIEAYVWYDTYVVDFGLPTVIDLSGAPYLHGDTDYKLTNVNTYLEYYRGQAEVTLDLENEKFTYTLKAPLTGYDIAMYTVEKTDGTEDPITYYIYLVPASNMLYEEGFLTPGPSYSFYAPWEGKNVSTLNAPGSMQGFDENGKPVIGTNVTPYGYDNAYAAQLGYSGGYYTTTVKADKFMSSALTVTVSNTTGFDIIGDAGPDSANMYVLVRANTAGATTRIIVVDTSFEDDTYGTLHQVPLLHVGDLDPAVTYEISISGGYMNRTSAASLTGFGGGSPISQIYSILYEMGLSDEEIENTEFVGFDDYNSVTFLNNDDIMTVAEGDQTLVIDGFRLYRDTKNSAYYSATNASGYIYTWEYNAVYTNVSDDGIQGQIYAYVAPNAVTDEDGNVTEYETGTYTVAEYDSIGGPQGEIYLPAGHGIVFQLSSTTADDPVSEDANDVITITAAQVSARAVTGATEMVSGTDTPVPTTIATNTEMYYNVAVDDSGRITIVNSGDKMLAIANVKALVPLAEINEKTEEEAAQAATFMMRAFAALPDGGSEDPGTDNTDPEDGTDNEEESGNTEKPAEPQEPIDPEEPTESEKPIEPEEPTEPEEEEDEDYVVIVPTFRPDTLDTDTQTYTLSGQKYVILTVTASADVSKLTVNGTAIWASNYARVQQGLDDEYQFSFLTVLDKNERTVLTVVAYNKNGLASRTYSVIA